MKRHDNIERVVTTIRNMDLAVPEIADITGLPVKSVENALRHARSQGFVRHGARVVKAPSRLGKSVLKTYRAVSDYITPERRPQVIDVPAEVVISTAIASRTPLEMAWRPE